MEKCCGECKYFIDMEGQACGECTNAKQSMKVMDKNETCSHFEVKVSKEECKTCSARLDGCCCNWCFRYPPVDVNVEPKEEVTK